VIDELSGHTPCPHVLGAPTGAMFGKTPLM
jgi:hypothetical protein